LTERFLETFVAVAFGFEFAFLEDHVKGVEVVFQFKIDRTFGGRKDNLDLVFCPWDLIDVCSVLDVRLNNIDISPFS